MIACTTCHIVRIVGREIAVDVRTMELLHIRQHRTVDEHLIKRLRHANIDVAISGLGGLID